MKLLCDLYRHWPVPLGSRSRDGRPVNQCWLCESPIVRRADGWQLDEGPRTSGAVNTVAAATFEAQAPA